MLKPRTAVRHLSSYHPPLASREGMRLDFNENTVGCSPRVLARLHTITAEELGRYPEREPVEALVAVHLGISPAELLLTNGVDEAIHLLCETYLEPGDEVVIVVPTFAMYEISASATGASIVRVPAEPDFRFPLHSVLGAINDRTRLIAIANPNNPTGAVAETSELFAICQAAPKSAVLVDEAYYHFYGQTILGAWLEHPNLFVARTFSKAYGLAGLRIGILAGSKEQIPMVRKISSPYNANAIALACLPAALSDEEYITRYVSEIGVGRARLESELNACGVEFWPSHANFVLMRLGNLNQSFIQSMRRRGILVRDRSSDPGCDGCVRITIGTSEQMERLLVALRATFDEIGLKQPEVV